MFLRPCFCFSTLLIFACGTSFAKELADEILQSVNDNQRTLGGQTVRVTGSTLFNIVDIGANLKSTPVECRVEFSGQRFYQDTPVLEDGAQFQRFVFGHNSKETVSLAYKDGIAFQAIRTCQPPRKPHGLDVNIFPGIELAFGKFLEVKRDDNDTESSFLRWFVTNAETVAIEDHSELGEVAVASMSKGGVTRKCFFRRLPSAHCLLYTMEKATRDGALTRDTIRIEYSQRERMMIPVRSSRVITREAVGTDGVIESAILQKAENEHVVVIEKDTPDSAFLPIIPASATLIDECDDPKSRPVWLLWLLVLAVACVGLVLLLRKTLRKKRT